MASPLAYKKGIWAENIASLLLRMKGFRILHKRYRCKQGEIDLIARRGKLLIFVEVKYRSSFEKGLEALQPHQRRRIEGASKWFLATNPYPIDHVRFDVIVGWGMFKWRHVPDAWRLN